MNKNNKNDITHNIAIVGSRKMSQYGKEVVAKLIPILVGEGLMVVTGRTNGVNAEVARMTRLCGGKIEVINGNLGMEKMNLDISKMADKLIVVEGGENSGTILVAKAFLDLGKDVWAVPGRMGDPNSIATNFLISNGSQVMLGEETIKNW